MNKKLPKITPGDILVNEFLVPMLAKKIGVDIELMIDIGEGKEPITEEIAEKLHIHYRTSKEFWLNLQKRYEEER
jgi:addiction module HigA family antidote